MMYFRTRDCRRIINEEYEVEQREQGTEEREVWYTGVKNTFIIEANQGLCA